mmetsp:Transcript_22718/g.65459  ORF Transcript_22718/g.65459 Transcript_22718/m.65459 type:complete len:239 (-) Transcript_22718:379-1095(-)
MAPPAIDAPTSCQVGGAREARRGLSPHKLACHSSTPTAPRKNLTSRAASPCKANRPEPPGRHHCCYPPLSHHRQRPHPRRNRRRSPQPRCRSYRQRRRLRRCCLHCRCKSQGCASACRHRQRAARIRSQPSRRIFRSTTRRVFRRRRSRHTRPGCPLCAGLARRLSALQTGRRCRGGPARGANLRGDQATRRCDEGADSATSKSSRREYPPPGSKTRNRSARRMRHNKRRRAPTPSCH